jgi:type IV secretion system protein VirB1
VLDLAVLANQCAPDVAPQVLERLMKVESSFNPYAIGVVGGRLARQPRHKEEAIATAQYLAQAGWNFSLGLGQVNRHNLDKYGLDYETVFDPCHNARAAAGIFNECLRRFGQVFTATGAAGGVFLLLQRQLPPWLSPEGQAQTSYVERIMAVKPTLTAAARSHCGDSGWSISPNGKSLRAKENRQTSPGAKLSQIAGASSPRGVKALRGD